MYIRIGSINDVLLIDISGSIYIYLTPLLFFNQLRVKRSHTSALFFDSAEFSYHISNTLIISILILLLTLQMHLP